MLCGRAPFQDPAEEAATKLRLELRRALELSGERAERLLQAEADAEACLRLVLALKQREAELEQDAASRAQLSTPPRGCALQKSNTPRMSAECRAA